jgi:YD repeat-containing protein
MRITCLLLLVSAISSSGCAGLIARSGTDVTALASRDEVHAVFGEPVATGVVEGSEGKTFEEYVTRKKIAALPEEPTEHIAAMPGDHGYLSLNYDGTLLFSLGTCELVLIPEQLTLIAVRFVGGEQIRFTYDRSDRLIEVQRNSNCDYFQSNTGLIKVGSHSPYGK